MTYKKIHIPDPCQQKWSQMLPEGKGRHCDTCGSIVIDFSKMSDEELIKTVESKKYECGKFSNEQLEKLYYIEETRKETCLPARQGKKYWMAIAASIVAGMFQVSGSYSQIPTGTTTHPLIHKSTSIERNDDPETPTAPVVKEEVQDEINLVIQSAVSRKGIPGISIIIDDLNIDSISGAEGVLTISPDKNWDLNQVITIKVDHPASKGSRSYKHYGKGHYKAKTIRIKLKKLINEEKIILLNLKKFRMPKRNYIMGRYI